MHDGRQGNLPAFFLGDDRERIKEKSQILAASTFLFYLVSFLLNIVPLPDMTVIG